MKKLYEKSELKFSLFWIIAYVVLFSVADQFSGSLGIKKVVTAPAGIVMALFLFCWIRGQGLSGKYGLCPFRGNWKDYLYFVPLLLIMSVNLWNGATMNVSVLETVLYILSMLCVGFIEEIVFRGFLFKALCKNSVKKAVLVASVTFGIGHIVNLLNGAEVLLTLLQICYATAIGFLLTIIFYKGKSLVPCIIAHGVVNSLSIFAVHDSQVFDIVTAAVLCVLSAGYALWILKADAAG
ncbi:MAG: CPBP family intramembrane metalloprotease [Muribaculaceae bacterium]|nr:CPBP family intramembrane metalloprotease [Muribaculaceae bacterium]